MQVYDYGPLRSTCVSSGNCGMATCQGEGGGSSFLKVTGWHDFILLQIVLLEVSLYILSYYKEDAEFQAGSKALD